MWGSIYIVTTFLPLLKRHFSGIPSDAYFIFCIPVLAAVSEENKHFSSYVFMKIKHASPHECQTSCCGCWPSECWTHPTLWLGRCRGPVESTHPSARPPPGWELQMMPVLTGSITHLPVVSYRIFSSRPYLHMELEFHVILPYHQRLCNTQMTHTNKVIRGLYSPSLSCRQDCCCHSMRGSHINPVLAG